MKHYFLFALLFFGLAVADAQRIEYSLDGEWNFQLDRDSVGWKSWFNKLPDPQMIQVPHTWNVEDGTERYFGLAWYEKTFTIPEEWKGKKIRLHFDAVYRDALVYINGKKAGGNVGSGFTPFSFDISDYIRYKSENKIIVSVSNKISDYSLPYMASFDWPNDGGIIRPVKLIITEKPSIRYVHIKPEINFENQSAKTDVTIKTWEKGVKKAYFTLLFRDYNSGEIILKKEKELIADNGYFLTQIDFDFVKLWHFDNPQLYTLQTNISIDGKVTDSFFTRFGFRKIEIKGHQLFLNEEPVRLPGIEYMPGSYPIYGMAEPESAMSEAVDLMKDLNCIITRFHWQQDARLLDLMDEKGILVQQEIPWWQAPGNLNPELEKLAEKHIDFMIERDFNRPSIFAWGVSNEVFYNTDKDIYRRLIDHARTWKSNALITVVSNEIFDRLENDESLLADIPTWNDYVGTWHGKAREETPEKLKLINERALRGRPLLITEHGLCEPRFVGGDARRVTEMTYHYDQWAKNDFILGCIYFSLNDYRTHRGESGKGRYQQRVHGLTDQWFGKKPSYYVYKGLASPVYFEWVQQSAKGTEARVSIAAKSDLPRYVLRSYRLIWKTKSGEIKEIIMPDLNPGEKFETEITDLDPGKKPVVSILRPTGFNVIDY